jgi:threonine synthase
MQQCSTCRHSFTDTALIWQCTCGGVLEYVRQGETTFLPSRIAKGPWSIYRYRDAIGLPAGAVPVTLGEGMTPLVDTQWHGDAVQFKLDYLCPTGSFKDRGASTLMTALRHNGVDEVLADSSGNAGASLAAYAAAAGLRCRIFIPAYAAAGKAAQIAAYGAELVRVPGTREDTTRAALEAARTSFYASHNWVPWFLEGTKTAAYELWEQSGWQVPDVVITPAGYGSYLLSLYLGFSDLLAAGLIKRLPRLVAAQAATAAPLVDALERDLDDVPEIVKSETIAEGISCAKPVRGALQLEAVRRSAGTAIAVAEEEIIAALRGMARQGFYIEPTSGAAPAALTRLQRTGWIQAGERVVVCLTGSGLKATDKLTDLL